MLLFSMLVNAAELGALDPEQLQALQRQQHALVVDVRAPEEWRATGIIADSKTLQAFDGNGAFNGSKWLDALQKLKSNPDQPIILVCRSGHRSAVAGKYLTEQGVNNVYHLQNGIQSWIQSGHPVTQP